MHRGKASAILVIALVCLCAGIGYRVDIPSEHLAYAAPSGRSGSAMLCAGFSPGGSAMQLVLDSISGAQTSIRVAAYAFTSKPIALALRDAQRRGVTVAVIVDAKSNGPGAQYSAATFLANEGVLVQMNNNYAIFHHKFMVIDDQHVQTGSFNYSASAEKRNAENVLLVRDAPELASLYAREWSRLWDESVALKKRY